jgi:hypothetical protein
MGDLLGNAGSPQLLFLLGFTLVGVVFFAAVIVFMLNRRRQKSKMKLGIQPKSATKKADQELNTRILSSAAAPAIDPTPPLEPPPDRPVEPDLSLDIQAKNRHTEPTPAIKETAIPLAARLDQLSSPAPTRQSPEPAELLRLLRHPRTGQLIVEVAGQRYNKLTDVTDKQVGQYILQLVSQLLAFTNGVIGTDAGVKAVYNPKVGKTPPPLVSPQPATAPAPAAPPQAAQPDSVPKPSPEAESAFLSSLQSRPLPPEPPSSRGLFGRPSPTPLSSPSILPGLNLADEINKIAQARLIASPLAAHTDLEITSDLAGGIRIKVNGVIYGSPDEIPSVEVRELIKASIKQWERS